jgi:hypothetical protein
MVDHESTRSRVMAMVRTRYPEDLDRAHLEALAAFEAEQTAAYARKDEL